MPELPEVEAARRAIEENCIGKTIRKSMIADDPKVIDGVSPKHLEASLVGRTIVAAHRKGKNMWLQLDSPPFPSFQFGMAGAIYIKGVAVTQYKRSAVKDTEEWPSKYSKFFVELDGGLELSFTDKRRFARIRFLDNPASVPPISDLGPDALLEPMTVDDFHDALRKKKIGIKALLLDQGFISDIGNWIADEVLFQARIHPLQLASSMSKECCATLLKCINEVIEKAVDVGADSSQFPSNWIFHSREKKPGKAFVDGKRIEFITAGGRTTAYVPELQKLGGSQAAKAAEQGNDEASGQKTTESKKRHPTKRKSGRKNADDADEEDEQGNDEASGRKTTESKKRHPTKRKSGRKNAEDDDSEDDHDDDDDSAEIKKTRGGKRPANKKKHELRTSEKDDSAQKKTKGKKTTVKRKLEQPEDDSGDASGEDGDEEDPKRKGVTKASIANPKEKLPKKKAK